MIQNAILSKPKYFMVTSYKCNRSVVQSDIESGGWTKYGVDCPPFNMPAPYMNFGWNHEGVEDAIFVYEVTEELLEFATKW